MAGGVGVVFAAWGGGEMTEREYRYRVNAREAAFATAAFPLAIGAGLFAGSAAVRFLPEWPEFGTAIGASLVVASVTLCAATVVINWCMPHPDSLDSLGIPRDREGRP